MEEGEKTVSEMVGEKQLEKIWYLRNLPSTQGDGQNTFNLGIQEASEDKEENIPPILRKASKGKRGK